MDHKRAARRGGITPDGYLAIPPTGKGDAVLVLHAWWGLNDTMKAFCTRLAQSGFVAFAPDLYHGKVADNIADAETLGKTPTTSKPRPTSRMQQCFSTNVLDKPTAALQ